MRTRVCYIAKQVIQAHSSIIEQELDEEFSTRVLKLMREIPSSTFPKTARILDRVEQVIAVQRSTPVAKPSNLKIRSLASFYLRCVRELSGTRYYETEGGGGPELKQWANRHLSGMTESQLLSFRSAMLLRTLPGEARRSPNTITALSILVLDELTGKRR
jgi:hypothetical protein